jgi:predicted ester cyclase
MVMTRGTTTGTHQGPFGEMPPTGKSISVQWVMVSRFEGDRIAEDFEVYDSLGLMQQLGAVPAPA